MEKIFRLLMVLALMVSLSLFASGCAKKTVETGPDASVAGSGAAVSSEADSGMASTEESLESAAGKAGSQTFLEGRTSAPLLPIYFDFDKFNLRADQVTRVEKNAAFLKANPRVRVRIEGNCDERGTNEYNMALGERRALSAKKYLVNLGVEQGRLKTMSYGEEKPMLHGHDELSWAQNRRDDFQITY